MAPLSNNNSRSKTSKLKDIPQRVYSINPNAKFIYLLREPVARIYSAYCYYVMNGRETQSFENAIKNEDFYLDVSDYYGQLSLWLEYFPLESFLFILFEDMKQNPLHTVQQCFQFIGVDAENIPIELGEPKNQSKYVNVVGRRVNRIFKELDYSGLGFMAPAALRKYVRELTTDDRKSFPKIPEAKRASLREYFSDKNHRLEVLTGLPLSQWQS